MALSLNDFVKKYNGKTVSGYSNEGGQCGDLARTWVKNKTGDPYYGLPPTGSAGVRQFYYNCDLKKWRKIAYEHGRVPPAGALLIHDVGTYGHVGIVLDGSTLDYARVFDQNWSVYHKCTKDTHRYTSTGVLGWLVLQGETVQVGPGLVKWAFKLAYGAEWWQKYNFYLKVKPKLKALLDAFVSKYGYSPVEAPNFFRKFLANNNVP